MSIYYDAPVGTKNDLEGMLRLNETVLRFSTMRTPSVVDEVLSTKPSNPWTVEAGLEVVKKAPKKKSLKYGLSHEDLDPDTVDMQEAINKYF